MKLALLSDLHSNLYALDTCINDALSRGATHFAILGDLVGYGPDPNAVVERCRELQASDAIVLCGNHEQMALTPPIEKDTHGSLTAHWTHRVLTDTNLRWLKTLPLTAQLDAVFLVHASADAPERWRYVDNEQVASQSLQAACTHPNIRYVFGGHVHHQTLYYLGQGHGLMPFKPVPGVPIPVPSHRSWIATVGSVGQPRDGDPRAAYALFDSDYKTLTFLRLDYDVEAAAQAVRTAGLPEALAKRLETGR